jgi:hypothetical protein
MELNVIVACNYLKSSLKVAQWYSTVLRAGWSGVRVPAWAKINIKLSLCFNRAPRPEGVLGEWRYSSTHSLTSALDGGEWSASRPGRLTPRERAPVTHWIGGWVGPRSVLDVVVKRKIPSPRRQSNPRTPIVQPVAQRYTDWAITALGSAWAGNFPLHHRVQTGSGAHTASCPIGTRGSFPGGKAAWAWSWPLTSI